MGHIILELEKYPLWLPFGGWVEEWSSGFLKPSSIIAVVQARDGNSLL